MVKTSIDWRPDHLPPNITSYWCISCQHLEKQFVYETCSFLPLNHQLQITKLYSTPSIVAIFGWIIPEPFAIPPILILAPPIFKNNILLSKQYTRQIKLKANFRAIKWQYRKGSNLSLNSYTLCYKISCCDGYRCRICAAHAYQQINLRVSEKN